ncbi:MAG: IclR family transcriptional regulator domain-containing protein, partial [Solirubrobacteraceae bacterium]
VQEACSAATLDLPDAVYVARVATRRLVSINVDVGSRVPATHSSLGRVLLADLPDDEIEAFVRSQIVTRHTEQTIVEHDRIIAEVLKTRERGHAAVDEELEIGLRSIAAPVRRADGRVVAAVNISAVASRVTVRDMRAKMLPSLLETAETISRAIVHQNKTRLDNPSRA